jgi:hypothetical protein
MRPTQIDMDAPIIAVSVRVAATTIPRTPRSRAASSGWGTAASTGGRGPATSADDRSRRRNAKTTGSALPGIPLLLRREMQSSVPRPLLRQKASLCTRKGLHSFKIHEWVFLEGSMTVTLNFAKNTCL